MTIISQINNLIEETFKSKMVTASKLLTGAAVGGVAVGAATGAFGDKTQDNTLKALNKAEGMTKKGFKFAKENYPKAKESAIETIHKAHQFAKEQKSKMDNASQRLK